MTTTITIETVEGESKDVRNLTVSPEAEQAVLRKFNPEGHVAVDMIKVLCAAVLTCLDTLPDADKRNVAIAKTHIETAQMHGVKSLFVNK